MQTHFENELAQLREKLLTMASLAETAVRQSVDALVNRDATLARQVKESDDAIDTLEVDIDNMAIALLAKAPLASDLRLVTVAMKIAQNLERVGDEASKIAKATRDLVQEAPLKQVGSIPALATMALEILKESLDCFVNANPVAARALIPKDKKVDEANKEIYRDLVRQMTADSATVQRGLGLIVVAKCLERIADHGKNVAEEVVYLYEAEDIRHPLKTRGSVPAQ